MSELSSGPVVDATPAPVSHEAPTPSDLGRMLSQLRQPKEPTPSEFNEAARAFVAERPSEQPELAEQADAAPAAEQSSGETTETPELEVPAIEPPRSWTRAEKERFQSLPRETQEYLHTREKDQEREFHKGQSELADQRKAVIAEREAAEKAKQQYEAQLPSVLQALQDAQQASFADIRTMADVERLQQEDPFRFQHWQVQQMKLQAASVEAERARNEKSHAEQSQWANHVQKENALAIEFIPDLADKVKGPALTQRAADRLKDLGFKPEELNALASGKQKLSIYDHRIQRLIFSDLKLSDIQNAKVTATAKPAPPVQRPGTAKPPGSAVTESVQNHMAKLERSGEVRDLGALIGALRRA